MVDFNERFQLFLVTRNAEIDLPPDARAIVSVINFSITRSGLEGQLLGVTSVSFFEISPCICVFCVFFALFSTLLCLILASDRVFAVVSALCLFLSPLSLALFFSCCGFSPVCMDFPFALQFLLVRDVLNSGHAGSSMSSQSWSSANRTCFGRKKSRRYSSQPWRRNSWKSWNLQRATCWRTRP